MPSQYKKHLQRIAENYVKVVVKDPDTPSNPAITILNTANKMELNKIQVSWITEPTYQTLIQQFHIFFRFTDTCSEPAAVGGRLCWTTESTQLRSMRRTDNIGIMDYQILVSYRTIDTRERSSFVSLSNLTNATPSLKDLAFVCEGYCKGEIFKVAHFIRDDSKLKHIIGVKLYKDGTFKSSAQPFHLQCVTRLMPLQKGPP